MRIKLLSAALCLTLLSTSALAITTSEIVKNPNLLKELPKNQIIKSNELIGHAKIKPDGKLYEWDVKVIGFSSEAGRIYLHVMPKIVKSIENGFLLIGGTGNNTYNEAMIKFVEDNVQNRSGITAIGTYLENRFNEPTLSVLTLVVNGKTFPTFTEDFGSQTTVPTLPQQSSTETRSSESNITPQPVTNSSDPCASANTNDIVACLETQYQHSDKKLNTAWKNVMSAIADVAKKKEIRNFQRQWIKDRDKYCAAPNIDGLGSIWRIKQLECLIFWVDYRTAQLEELSND